MEASIMSNIYVNVIGNGSAWVDNAAPSNGDVITLYAYAVSGYFLIDISAVDQNGYSIAMAVTPVQQFVYDANWGDVTIAVKFSHDIITINDNGQGFSYVSNYYPADGESVTLVCNPDPHCEVINIVGTDQNGNDIGLIIADTQSFTYYSSYGDVTIDVYYDKKFLYKNLWLLALRQWWRKNNF